MLLIPLLLSGGGGVCVGLNYICFWLHVFPSLLLSVSVKLLDFLSVPLVSLTFILHFLLDCILIT